MHSNGGGLFTCPGLGQAVDKTEVYVQDKKTASICEKHTPHPLNLGKGKENAILYFFVLHTYPFSPAHSENPPNFAVPVLFKGNCV